MRSMKDNRGVTGWEIVVVIVVLVVVGLIVAATQSGKGTTPPSQVPGAANTCFTYCLGLVELQCGDNEVIGVCLGVWDCTAQIGAHECR
ncbi:MAG: hypothetical protein AB1671_07200 [Thermodesulfobacteriota bacterium]